MFSGGDPILLLILVLTVAAVIWTSTQIQTLSRRLNALEKQHLALVADLEERLFGGPPNA